jgi:fluoride ion exporter CrcB/FEX
MLRYALSRYNAWRRCIRFPFFTFFVNVVGSIGLAFTAISIDLRGYNIDTDVPGYTLRGFQVGFFGTFLASLLLLLPLQLLALTVRWPCQAP